MSNIKYPNFTVDDMIAFADYCAMAAVSEEDLKNWLMLNSEETVLKKEETYN